MVRSHRRAGLIAGCAVAISAVTAAVGCSSPSSQPSPAGPGSTGAASSSSLGFKLVTPGSLTVAFTDGNLPQITTGNGGISGMDAYWINQFAAKNHLTVKPVPTTFTAMLEGVQTGKYDLGTTAYWTPARAKQVYYTLPDFTDPLGILTKKDTAYSGPASLKGQKVGTLAGYSFISYMDSYYGAGNVQTFSTIVSGLQALHSGLIKGWVDGVRRVDGNTQYLKQFPDLTGHELPWGALSIPAYIIDASSYNFVNCGNQGLATAMDKVQSQLLSSGAYTKNAQQFTPAAAAVTPANKTPQQSCGS